ncbi:MAG: Crp/Fnr family transcriptional regulator, partial [Thiobacillaceae bacterium]
FAAMTEAEIDELLRGARLIEVPARRVVFHSGEAGDSLYVLLSGKVKVSLLSADGKEAILSLMGAGDVFGEMSLLDGPPRSATVTSLEDCRLLQIGRHDFVQFLKRHTDVALKLLAALSQRLRTTNNLVENLSFHHLPSRLARLLLDLGQRHGKAEPDGIEIGLRLSQEELGNLVGASRESVNKQLRAWADAGLLEYRQGVIVIRKVDALFMQSLTA